MARVPLPVGMRRPTGGRWTPASGADACDSGAGGFGVKTHVLFPDVVPGHPHPEPARAASGRTVFFQNSGSCCAPPSSSPGEVQGTPAAGRVKGGWAPWGEVTGAPQKTGFRPQGDACGAWSRGVSRDGRASAAPHCAEWAPESLLRPQQAVPPPQAWADCSALRQVLTVSGRFPGRGLGLKVMHIFRPLDSSGQMASRKHLGSHALGGL